MYRRAALLVAGPRAEFSFATPLKKAMNKYKCSKAILLRKVNRARDFMTFTYHKRGCAFLKPC